MTKYKKLKEKVDQFNTDYPFLFAEIKEGKRQIEEVEWPKEPEYADYVRVTFYKKEDEQWENLRGAFIYCLEIAEGYYRNMFGQGIDQGHMVSDSLEDAAISFFDNTIASKVVQDAIAEGSAE